MEADQTRTRTRHQSATTITLAACLILLSMAVGGNLHADDQTLDDVNQLLTGGKAGQAAQMLRSVDDSVIAGNGSGDVDLTIAMAVTARALEQANKLKDAAEFYQRAVVASKRDAAKELSAEKIRMVRLAAASTLARAANYKAALDAVEPVLSGETKLDDERKRLIVRLCLHVGSQAFTLSKPELAGRAYELARKHADDESRATAMLGAGWAAAMQQTKPEAAAEKLAAFIKAYPKHADTPRATALQITCLKQAGRDDEADKVLSGLLEDWPHSPAATEAVTQYTPKAKQELTPTVAKWLLRKADRGDLQDFTPRLTALAVVAAASEKNEKAFSTLADRLGEIDDQGHGTSEALQTLAEAELDSHAQRMAVALIAPKADKDVEAASREAACRWVGREQMWSMLALASESADPKDDDPTRTVAIERLFAEGLMQTGRQKDAQAWWIHLVDVRKVDDFATLLRCAETATSVAKTTEAEERIAAARAMAGDDPARVALVDMLAADLSIRRLKFDAARSVLENVVQSGQSVPALRARAQWMIGESFFLQHKFVEAIEAYRRVEGLQPDGAWVVASLVQAGKSFEQLGRTREATICYSSLIKRFPDSQHADVARRRLAAIAPNQSNPKSDSSSGTIRR